MVGPNPYKIHSYAEYLHFGPVYVVCYGCARYALVIRALHGDRDARCTTWSCCVCGVEGKTTQEKPMSNIRADVRADPRRHPRALARLTGDIYRPSRAIQLKETPKDRRRLRD